MSPDAPITVGDWLRSAGRRLQTARPEGALEARLLLQSVLTAPPAHLFARPERVLSADEATRLEELLAERLRGTPLQHLTGSAAFRNLELAVPPGVFVPRPETEGLVDRVLDVLKRRGGGGAGAAMPTRAPGASTSAGVTEAAANAPRILELCAGSGAILLALLDECPNATGVGVELSPTARAAAEANAAALFGAASGRAHRRPAFLDGDLFAPLPGRELPESFDVIVANPPYIPEGLWGTLPREVRVHESPLALLGGPDGTDVVARIVAGAPAWLKRGGLLALEIDESHGERVRELLDAAGRYRDIAVERDLAGRTRYAVALRR
jgi:release factor glutamine methyltransferase